MIQSDRLHSNFNDVRVRSFEMARHLRINHEHRSWSVCLQVGLELALAPDDPDRSVIDLNRINDVGLADVRVACLELFLRRVEGGISSCLTEVRQSDAMSRPSQMMVHASAITAAAFGFPGSYQPFG